MQKILPKSLHLRKETAHGLIMSIILVLVGVSAFGLGRLTAMGEKTKRVVIHSPMLMASVAEAIPSDSELPPSYPVASETKDFNSAAATSSLSVEHNFVASKNGTKYYLPTCSGAARIKPMNQIWFATVADAKLADYTPSATCPQLK